MGVAVGQDVAVVVVLIMEVDVVVVVAVLCEETCQIMCKVLDLDFLHKSRKCISFSRGDGHGVGGAKEYLLAVETQQAWRRTQR